MNIRVLIGPAGSGKTFGCMKALHALERAAECGLLLVPDQFTYAADRLLLDDPSLPGVRFIRVLSFRRLAHLLGARQRSAALVLSEQGRRMLLRRIVQASSPKELGPLARVRETLGFVDALAGGLKEAKGIAGRDAAARLASAGAAQRNAKIEALARLVAAYDRALDGAGLVDPEEWTHLAAADLAHDPGPWRNQTVWVDGFASFTPVEKVLLRALSKVAGPVTVTLCCDPRDGAVALKQANEAARHGIAPSSAEFWAQLRRRISRPAFLPTLRTLIWLNEISAGSITLAHLPQQDSRPSEQPPHRFRQAPELAHLESNLFRNGSELDKQRALRTGGRTTTGARPTEEIPCVTILHRPHPYHEVMTWARRIDHWARLAPQPVRYRDIAILVRELNAYRPIIQEIFRRFGIPFFVDERRDVTAHPLLRLSLSALAMATQGWTREDVISLLRNPILELSQDTVDHIENLSLEYGIEYERWREWRNPWEVVALPQRERMRQTRETETGDEDGLDQPPEEDEFAETATEADGRKNRQTKRRELAADQARQVAGRFFQVLEEFTGAWHSGDLGFTDGATALRKLLRACLRGGAVADGAKSERLEELITARHFESWSESENRQIVALVEETLRSGSALMGKVPIGAGLFTRLLKDAVFRASIGLTPRILDAVTIAEPRRSRVNEARKVILGGLDAASFPRPHDQDPLLTDAERERMAASGLPMASPAVLQTEEDPYLFYIACTRATEELVLTVPGHGENVAAREPSPYIKEVERILDLRSTARIHEPQRVDRLPGLRSAESPLARCQQAWELPARLLEAMRAMDPTDADEMAGEARRRLAGVDDAVEHSLRRLRRMRRPLPEILAPGIAAEIFPDGELRTSASRLETFAQCPFQHFAKHLLRLEPRPEPTLTPLSTGSAAHGALERFFAKRTLPASEHEAAARMREIFKRLAREEEFRIFQKDPPSAYRWDRTCHNLELFIRTEFRRLQESGFRPAAVELAFGLPGSEADAAELRDALTKGDWLKLSALPALEIAIDPEKARQAGLPAGQRWLIRLRGRADRLDIATGKAGRLEALVIDYKQGKQETNIARELKRGLNLQVAMYLLAVREILGLEPGGGIYYSFNPKSRKADDQPKAGNEYGFGMRGIVLASARERIDPAGAFLGRGTLSLGESPGAGGMPAILEHVRGQIADHGLGILRGAIHPYPSGPYSRLPCRYCDFARVCRFDPRVDPIRTLSAEPRKAEKEDRGDA